MDPDHFTADPVLWKRWAKSFLIVFNYYWYGLKHFRSEPRILAGYAGALTFNTLLIYTAFTVPGGMVLLFGWFLPAFLAIGVLGYTFTAWPHHPAQETDRIHNTRNLYVPVLLQWILCNQNLHHVHHLKPSLPWFKYPEFWREHEKEYLEKGARVSVYTQREPKY